MFCFFQEMLYITFSHGLHEFGEHPYMGPIKKVYKAIYLEAKFKIAICS